MRIRFATHPFEGERIIRTSPEISNVIHSKEWTRRPNLYTGRALTANTLINSTKHHIRHLQLFGRHLSRGVIHGLTMTHYVGSYIDSDGTEQPGRFLKLTPGLGLTSWGDDVTLSETTDIFLNNVSVINIDDPPRGAGVFVLQPLEIFDEIVDEPEKQCQWDEERDPFDDEQIVDGCRLVFFPWPGDILGPIPPVEARRFRNQLVYQIFEYEQEHPDILFPWEYVGIPLALTYITFDTGEIWFIDQQAVVRQGGAPLTTKLMLSMNGTPFLWESRIQQFIGHLYDISQNVGTIPSAHEYFEVLPPVGILPGQALNFDDMSTKFFPSQFIIDATPIPEEQLEVAMNASAGLRPFDLYQPEKIKLLVPVPQSVYEPDLLKEEQPDPIFLETLRKIVREIRKMVSNRNYLRNMARRVIGAMDVGKIPEFEDDKDTIPDENIFPVLINRDEEIAEYGVVATNAVSALYHWIRKYAPGVSDSVIDPLLPTESKPPDFQKEFKGLENFILDLKNDIKKTEDLLDFGYVRAETDMYRLRQLLLGSVKSSRLATSPALGQMVGGQTIEPTTKDVESYFETAFTSRPGDVGSGFDLAMDPDGKSEEEKLSLALNIIKKMETGERLSTREMYEATQGITSAFSKRVGGDVKAITMVAQPDRVRFENDDTYTFQPEALSSLKKFRDSAVIPKSVGIIRTKPLVDRIYESPSMEVKSSAVKTKTSIFDSLAGVPFEIDEKVTVVSGEKAILEMSDYEAVLKKLDNDACREALEGRAGKSGQWVVISTAPLTDAEKSKLNDEQKNRLSSVLNDNRHKKTIHFRDLKDKDLGIPLREGLFDPDPADGDEADYFTAGVTALEHGLNAMRLIEKNLNDYKKALTQSQNVHFNLLSNAQSWRDKLGETDEKLMVLRHDALVTRSLFEEERSRISVINQQRSAILDNYVTTLVFVRPRLVDSRLDVLSVPLHGEYVNPVPACLAEDYEAFGELADMLGVFREIPIAWLSDAKGLVRLVDNRPGLLDMMKHARGRIGKSTADTAAVPSESYRAYNTNEYGKAINKIVYANQTYKQAFSQQKMAWDFTDIRTKTWLELVDHAESLVSLADLIEMGKGHSKLGRKAIEIMENLEDVAVCLYHLCNELEPAIRLKWANLISIYDKPVDLRHLERLPYFEKIGFTFRRDLQNMVDWLFSQVDTSIDQARQTMNDLVRVCILLASHAPVSTIVNGYANEPTTGTIGDFVDVIIDKGQTKVGMAASVFIRDGFAAQGVVVDVGEKTARIQVTQTWGGKTEFNIDKGAQVKFISGNLVKAFP